MRKCLQAIATRLRVTGDVHLPPAINSMTDPVTRSGMLVQRRTVVRHWPGSRLTGLLYQSYLTSDVAGSEYGRVERGELLLGESRAWYAVWSIGTRSNSVHLAL